MDGPSSNYQSSTQNYFWSQKGFDVLGRGGFGKVYKGRNSKTGEFVAVKLCDKEDDVQHTVEIDIMNQLSSPYIVRYIAAEPVKEKRGLTALIMELADGNVRDELKKLENCFGLPLDTYIRLIKHLERGLSYLNMKKIAHRDMKPENILVFNTVEGMTFKICDFGGSRVVTDDFQPLHSIRGTPGYLNEYLAVNLARNTSALTYTKDECDLWSVGCTLYECATGVLPFVPANGVVDTAGMYDMMIKRPSEAICGNVDVRGEYVWGKDFPEDRCFYPSSFRKILCGFLRQLFRRNDGRPLTFREFESMCNEIISLKRTRVLKINNLYDEDFFSTTGVSHFDKNYIDSFIEADLPPHNLLCLLTLPEGNAITCQEPIAPSTFLDQSKSVVVLALNKETEGYSTPLTLTTPSVVKTLPAANRHPRDKSSQKVENRLREMKLTAANILHLERQITRMQQIIPDLLQFSREIGDKASRELELLNCKLTCAKHITEAMRLQSLAIALHKESVREKKAVENNSFSVSKELQLIEETFKSLRKRLQQIEKAIVSVESKKPRALQSLKGDLENVIKTRTCSSAGNSRDADGFSLDFERLFLSNAYEKTIHLFEKTATEMSTKYMKPLDAIIREMYDLTRNVQKLRKQLEEVMQLIGITEETNRQRLETLKRGEDEPTSSAATSVDLLPEFLEQFELHAKQQKRKAESSLEATKQLLHADSSGTMH